jgi:hypothetical protein
MRFKGTLVLLTAAIAFGGYIYFYEMKGGEKREKAKQTENQLWKLETKNIVRLTLDSADSHIAAERKSDQTWTLTAPQAWDADSAELNRLASSTTMLSRESVIEPNAQDLTRFGLNPAHLSLRIKVKGGKEFGVDFGINNPTGNSTYAVLAGTKDVFLVPANSASSFIKKVDDLRDHAILKLEPATVQSLTLKNPKGTIEIFKDGEDRWWFKGPEKRAADGPEVRGILNALSMGKAKEFFNENANDYANAGLDKPLIDASLTVGADKTIKRLIIGVEKSKLQKKGAAQATKDAAGSDALSAGLYLARDESRPFMFFVEKELVDKLLKPANDIREKALVSFQRWDIDSIFLTNPKGSFAFSKAGGEWFLAGTQRKAKWDAINEILDALEKPVKEWIDKPASLSSYGIDTPPIRIVLKKGSTVIAGCTFGKSTKDGIYAQALGDSSLKVADPNGLEILNKTESDFVEATPATSRPKQ